MAKANQPGQGTLPVGRSSWREWVTRERAVLILVAVYVLGFFLLAMRQWACLGRDTGMTGEFNNMFWWTMRGRPFYFGAYEENYFSLHASFYYLLVAPFYWLVPGVPTVWFLQVFVLGLSAIPMYLLARHCLEHKTGALVATAAYLFYPPIVAQCLGQLQDQSYLPFVLLFAVYFFVQRNFGRFVLLTVLTCLGREVLALVVCMFGLWALLERRDWKWVVTPIAIGVAYFVFVMAFLMPYLRQGAKWHIGTHFLTYLGSTPGEALLAVLKNPSLLLNHFLEQDVIRYFLFMTGPLGVVLPFLSPAGVIALPELAINLVSGDYPHRVISYHYNVLAGTGLVLGTLFTFKRISTWLQRHGGGSYAMVFGVGLLLLSLSHWFLWLNVNAFRKLPHHDALVRALQVVPPDASILTGPRLLGHVTERTKFDTISVLWDKPNTYPMFRPPEYAGSFEYVVMDANERAYPPFINREMFQSLYGNPKYQLIFAEQNVFVFRRVNPAPAASR